MTRIKVYAAALRLVILSFGWVVQGTKAFTIQSKSFDFRGHSIAYEEATRVHDDIDKDIDKIIDNKHNHNNPVLLLNGFGVGSFHQHRVMPNLISIPEKKDEYGAEEKTETETTQSSESESTRTIYGIDYLGQGRSWPVDCDDGNSKNEEGLIYSIDTWADQIIEFIERIVVPNHQHDHDPTSTRTRNKVKVNLIGNSVGGHLAVVLAAKRPDLIQSICLLNATPVWGLNLKGWSGHLPPPFIPRAIGRYLFDRIRDLGTIEKYLEAAYANRGAFDETLIKQIRGCTEGKGGHAAFASIMYSPPASFPSGDSFYQNLAKLECDVLLLFGKEDPWCTPAFAKRMFQCLQERDDNGDGYGDGDNKKYVHRYVELENVGHCPNHEAPTAVGHIANRWIQAEDRGVDALHLLDEDWDETVFDEPWGKISAREVDKNDTSLSFFEKLITTFV